MILGPLLFLVFSLLCAPTTSKFGTTFTQSDPPEDSELHKLNLAQKWFEFGASYTNARENWFDKCMKLQLGDDWRDFCAYFDPAQQLLEIETRGECYVCLFSPVCELAQTTHPYWLFARSYTLAPKAWYSECKSNAVTETFCEKVTSSFGFPEEFCEMCNPNDENIPEGRAEYCESCIPPPSTCNATTLLLEYWKGDEIDDFQNCTNKSDFYCIEMQHQLMLPQGVFLEGP